MTCCAIASPVDGLNDGLEEERLRAASKATQETHLLTEFHVPAMHCIACVRRIEDGLSDLPFVQEARANLTTQRVRVTWDATSGKAAALSKALSNEGFEHTVLQLGQPADDAHDETQRQLLYCVGVAGFATANIMLLSVSVWSGADAETRQLFHLISGLIAVPAVFFAGRPFFASALGALSHRRLNMDVPISLAVLLALAMSIIESLNGGEEAYFDAAAMLLFFLLIGRALDHAMRVRARGAVSLLTRLAAKGAVIIHDDGSHHYVPIENVQVGDRLMVAAGERVPVDGVVRRGQSEVDRSLVTGESEPVRVGAGEPIEAGIVNLGAPFEIEATKSPDQSFIGEIVAMMAAAENGKSRFIRIADRAARIYAPAVHILALLTFIGWLVATHGDWQSAAYTAIAVLIITCPCALGLAVPIVHVVGAERLFSRGIFMKDGAAFEKLSEADTIVFDKTGTLTLGRPEVGNSTADPKQMAIAGALARRSRHPAAQAIARYTSANPSSDITIDDIVEVPGAGIEGVFEGGRVRLGRPDWVGERTEAKAAIDATGATVVAFAVEGGSLATFEMEDRVRPDAREAVSTLRNAGLDLHILSGDAEAPVRNVADRLDVGTFASGQKPADKIAYVDRLQRHGRKVLMVGDGLNDAPALAAGHVSMAPSSGSDVGRQAADFVFAGDSLDAVPFAYSIAKRTDQLVKQNIGLAVAYNCIAVPLAIAGLVTPLVAAIAMSASSILVVANSLRLRLTETSWPVQERSTTDTQASTNRFGTAALHAETQA